MTAEGRRAQDLNRNILTLDIDGLGRSIVFKRGGHVTSPVRMHAASGGGVYAEGLFTPWDVEGEVTVSKSLAQWLVQTYQQRNRAEQTSAVMEFYSSTENVRMKYHFGNARIRQLIDFGPSELGGMVAMKIAFSLNDLESMEVA